ncbi:ATP-dependent DNA helicase PcrA [Mycoplasmopsis pullorum]|uniref:ATP-dependent helicase n=1 Tax=Mycoplasmopsis pullorum TaxID=48003 RepID=UPI0011187CE0|nr:UvrD-helicase domain-containing protein [Mycoplasmopsis pullorum]TNK81680.1 ATP-dependent DNA helicase PcrA [Mycoplasmopsis pullorum]TNK82680.1 ATP-dependent DNA helicase PcrA [Mycoplasmopsis pullorum]TNK84547.1 ATP-dependent DNA helicase PcrA [Mycoplasmopsis pullorum]TNK84639.1 ATP-dependent DNA helicase PcrA [Mycoplasmopsis pullorum]TNK85418.1 ATP-dependent DNA helicase PcrA [Mycoplasmopsis pullorum]
MKVANNNLLEDLNSKQKEAVEYFDSPLRIVAGAGSGKTKVLTRKIAYLVNELGIAPKEILAVTFTNKACNEMAIRIRQYCGNLTNELTIKTFHSLCALILREESRKIGLRSDFQILDEVDKKAILTEIYEKLDIQTNLISLSNMMNYISWAKNHHYSKSELKEALNSDEIIPKVYSLYNKKLRENKCLDFDDLILKVNDLFEAYPEVVQKWANKFKYILVDEFQDTSDLQYKIIKYLYNPEDAHITIVGDPDQTIYEWRGAEVDLILDFDQDFKDTKTIVLDINYRSTKKILRAANKLIKNNKFRFNKDLQTENPEGDDIEFFHAFSNEAEARWVVQKINELKKQKIQLKNIAILYRSNYYSRAFEEALINENINHKIFNGTKFFQRAEIKDSLAYLRVLYDGSDIAFERIINIPARGIGKSTLAKLKQFAQEKEMGLFECVLKHYKELPIKQSLIVKSIFPLLKDILTFRKALEKNKFSLVLLKFLEKIKYFEAIEQNVNMRGQATDNVRELIKSMETWEQKNPNKSLKDYLDMVSLMSAGDEYDDFSNYVSLMTVHSAKGLEFDNVFVVGMTEQIFPSYKGLNRDNSKDWMEEERRLAYVAITRAKKKLFITDSRGNLIGTDIPKETSRFVEEMGIDLDDVILAQSQTASVQDYDDEEINNNIIPGDIISHTTFGEGQVLEVLGDTIVVEFVKDKKVKSLRKNHPAIKVIVSV